MEIKEIVKEKYGQAAIRAKTGGSSCCGSLSTRGCDDPITSNLYDSDQKDEMLALAEENKRKAGVSNAEFLKGEIENIPLPDNSVDVIISNCVINLSGNKDRV